MSPFPSSLNNVTSDISNVPLNNAQLPSFNGFLEILGQNKEATLAPIFADEKLVFAKSGTQPSTTSSVCDENRMSSTGHALRPHQLGQVQRGNVRRRRAQSCPEYLGSADLGDNSPSPNANYSGNNLTLPHDGDNRIDNPLRDNATLNLPQYSTLSREEDDTTPNGHRSQSSTHAWSYRTITPAHYVPSDYAVSIHHPPRSDNNANQFGAANFSNHPYTSYVQPHCTNSNHQQVPTGFRARSNAHHAQPSYATTSSSMIPSNPNGPSDYAHPSYDYVESPNYATASSYIDYTNTSYSAYQSARRHHGGSGPSDRANQGDYIYNAQGLQNVGQNSRSLSTQNYPERRRPSQYTGFSRVGATRDTKSSIQPEVERLRHDCTTTSESEETWDPKSGDQARCACRICIRAHSKGESGRQLNDATSELPRVQVPVPASSSVPTIPIQPVLSTTSTSQHCRTKRSRNHSPGGAPPPAKKLKVYQLRPAETLFSETDDDKFICRYVGPACPKPEGCLTLCSDSRSLARHLRMHAKWEVDHNLPEDKRVVFNGMPEKLLWQNVRCGLNDNELMRCKYYREKGQRWEERTLERHETAIKEHNTKNH